MNRRKFILTAGATAASIGIAGCSGSDSDGESPDPEGTSADEGVGDEQDMFFGLEEGETTTVNNLAVESSRLVRDTTGSVGVVGDVQNTSDDVVFTFLQMQATLLDGNDEELITFSDNTEQTSTDRVEPGEVWDFEIWFEGADLEGATSYNLSVMGETGDADGTETGTPTG